MNDPIESTCPLNLTSSYALAVLADNPLCYWQMQECNGDLFDSGSLGLELVWQSGSRVYRQGSPLSAQGTYSILQAGGNTAVTSTLITTARDNVSCELWINLNSPYVTQNQQPLFYNGNGNINGWGLVINVDRTFQTLCGGIAYMAKSSAISVDTWHHFVMVRAAGTWKYYIDGVIDKANAGTTTPNVPAAAFSHINGQSVQRYEAHVAVYDTALSAAQVAAHYAAR